MTGKTDGKGKEVYPGADGVNSAQEEIFANNADGSADWYTDAVQALSALKSGHASNLVYEVAKTHTYIVIKPSKTSPNSFEVKRVAEDDVFRGDYSKVTTETMNEKQVINLLSG
jgi:hypothetical protein